MFTQRTKTITCLSVSAIVLGSLSACGGGGSSDSSPSNSSLIIGTGNGQPASDASTSEIQAKAYAGATEGLRANLDNLDRLGNDVTLNTPLPGQDGALDDPLTAEVGSDTDTFFEKSLRIDDTQATVVREGDVITIDPDENRICEDTVPLAGEANDDADVCRQLFADLTVEIAAASEDTGVVSWLFQGSPVFLIGYAPTASSYELDLAGLQSVWDRAATLQDLTYASTSSMSGRFRLESELTNATVGAEAGTMALSVVQAINISDTAIDGGFNLAPSTLLSMNADSASGDASMAINWGALNISASSGDSEGNSSVQTIAMGGLTGQVSVSGDDQSVSITNVGIADVPVTLTVDSIETVSAEFDTVGFSVDEETGALLINGALGVRVAMNNLAGMFEEFGPEYIANANLSAPSGTAFLDQLNGNTAVTAGGPFTASYSAVDNSQDVQQSITVNAGSCFGKGDDDAELLVARPCD